MSLVDWVEIAVIALAGCWTVAKVVRDEGGLRAFKGGRVWLPIAIALAIFAIAELANYAVRIVKSQPLANHRPLMWQLLALTLALGGFVIAADVLQNARKARRLEKLRSAVEPYLALQDPRGLTSEERNYLSTNLRDLEWLLERLPEPGLEIPALLAGVRRTRSRLGSEGSDAIASRGHRDSP